MDNSHCGYITKLQDVRPHPNADKLQLATVFGNQVVIPLEYKEGDIGVYFPTDLRLGVEFAEANNLVRKKEVDHVASLVFYEDGDTVSLYKEGRFIYYGHPTACPCEL